MDDCLERFTRVSLDITADSCAADIFPLDTLAITLTCARSSSLAFFCIALSALVVARSYFSSSFTSSASCSLMFVMSLTLANRLLIAERRFFLFTRLMVANAFFLSKPLSSIRYAMITLSDMSLALALAITFSIAPFRSTPLSSICILALADVAASSGLNFTSASLSTA